MNKGETITISKEQYREILNLIGNGKEFKEKHYREIKSYLLPEDSICIGYEQAAYGDWNYYLTPSGEYVCTYFSIGD
jgi:hypothetical protein